MPRTLSDLVAEADWIAEADLIDAHARRNARGNLIVTDYRFRSVETVLGAPAASVFVLTQGGGTLNGETHWVSDAPALVVGQRYLVFVRPDRGELFAPFVGGAQGVYDIAPDGSARSLAGDGETVPRDALMDSVRDLAHARGAAPPRRLAPNPEGNSYPMKDYLPLALASPAMPLLGAPQDLRQGLRPSRSAAVEAVAAGAASATAAIETPDYVYSNRISPPAAINAFPHDWVWHPEEEYQMSKWNQYGGTVFQVYTTPTGTWAWGNGRFDLAGWPSSEQMVAQFGEGWAAGTLGVTFSRSYGGPIVEADTALNPAYCWTLDEAYASSPANGCWGFRQTMLHELGHSWGLHHPWETQQVWWDSVMNYSPKQYRFPRLFTDDANAIRAAFGGPALHDALLSLYRTSLSGSAGTHSSAVYTPTQFFSISAFHGDDLAQWIASPFKVENLGTDVIAAPRVDFYLSQDRLDWNYYAYLGSAHYSDIPVFYTSYMMLPALPIPYTTPTGNYYLGAFLPEEDANMENNAAWADDGVTIQVRNRPTTLYPEFTRQYSEIGNLGPAGTWQFLLAADAGVTYELSLCDADGGWANFDSTLMILDQFLIVAENDDDCGLQSRLVWTAPHSGTFTLVVGSYAGGSKGYFSLAYDLDDRLFASGFE